MTTSEGPIKLLAISGSIRRASFCTSVLHAMGALLAQHAEMQVFPLNDIPLYNADLDGDDLPPPVARLKAEVHSADGLIVCSPEYNYGMSGVLKNAIDWASRPGFASPMAGKPVLIVTASPGTSGGVRAQSGIREALTATMARPLSRPHVAIANVAQRLQDHRFCDETTQQFVQRALDDLIEEIAMLSRRSKTERVERT